MTNGNIPQPANFSPAPPTPQPAQTPISQQPQDTPKKKKKTWIMAAGAVAAVILLFAAYRFTLGEKNQPQPSLPVNPTPTVTPTPSPVPSSTPTPSSPSSPSPTSLPTTSSSPTATPDPTEGWESYENEKHQFEIKYPSEKQTVVDIEDPYIGICDLGKSEVAIKIYPLNITIPEIEPGFTGELAINIDVEPNQENKNVDEWINENCQGTWVIDSTRRNVQIAGIEATEITGSSMGKTKLLVFTKNQKVYFIHAWSGQSGTNIWQTFDQILSTFKFLN